MTLSYSFQPDCYRPDAGSACVQTVDRLDLGPQIAVWVQSADGSQFVDTLMVTNLTAVRGIGNRPGRWDFLSAPLFPYGKRPMALPIWAHARGVLYNTVVMTEAICAVGGPNYPGESCLGWHEPYSSPESYYCRPLKPGEINVDAISCASAFHSEKGKFDPTTKSYYPPRGDLTTFTSTDGADPPTYAAVNDLDAVAAATPAYGAPYTGTWNVPVDLADGDYVVMVEVNKEFDSNAANMHADYDDPNLPGYGIDGNFGQPSVVYSVPIHIDLTSGTPAQAAVSQIAGYGDWSGATGTITPQDGTISTTDLGSGEERLRRPTGGRGSGRVHVGLGPCLGCNPLPPADRRHRSGSDRRRSHRQPGHLELLERASERWSGIELRDPVSARDLDDGRGLFAGDHPTKGAAGQPGHARLVLHLPLDAEHTICGGRAGLRWLRTAFAPRPDHLPDAGRAVHAALGLLRGDGGLGLGAGAGGEGDAASPRSPAAHQRPVRRRHRHLLPLRPGRRRSFAPQRHRPSGGPPVPGPARGGGRAGSPARDPPRPAAEPPVVA